MDTDTGSDQLAGARSYGHLKDILNVFPSITTIPILLISSFISRQANYSPLHQYIIQYILFISYSQVMSTHMVIGLNIGRQGPPVASIHIYVYIHRYIYIYTPPSHMHPPGHLHRSRSAGPTGAIRR
jgi:hypothetical protein